MEESIELMMVQRLTNSKQTIMNKKEKIDRDKEEIRYLTKAAWSASRKGYHNLANHYIKQRTDYLQRLKNKGVIDYDL